MPTDVSLGAVLPLVVLVIAAMLVLLVGVFAPRQRWLLGVLSLAGVGYAILATRGGWGTPVRAFAQTVVADNLATSFALIALVAAALSILLAAKYVPTLERGAGELHALVLLATSGMIMMAMAEDLIVAFIGLEVLSIPLYVLAGYARDNPQSREAALKYLILGALASAFLLYGIALTYAATGSTNLLLVSRTAPGGNWLMTAGIVMLVVGLGFKAAFVPFHMWVPDVYQGAPTPITAFMAAVPKAGAFALLLRVFVEGFSDADLQRTWVTALWAVAVATMTLGNVVALRQTQLKRMLAYSSIAHAGYLLVAVLAASAVPTAYQSAIFYMAAYALMNLGAFAVIILSTDDSEGDPEIASLAGFGERQPLAALAMAAFMFSLTGVPPLAGFAGKLLVFRDAVHAGFVGLAMIAVLNSVVSAYYYLRVVVIMYMQPTPEKPERASIPVGVIFTAAVCALAVLLLGLRPDWVLRWL